MSNASASQLIFIIYRDVTHFGLQTHESGGFLVRQLMRQYIVKKIAGRTILKFHKYVSNKRLGSELRGGLIMWLGFLQTCRFSGRSRVKGGGLRRLAD